MTTFERLTELTLHKKLRWGLLAAGAWLSACGVGNDFEPPIQPNGPGLPDDAVVLDPTGGTGNRPRRAKSPGLRNTAGGGGRASSNAEGEQSEGTGGSAGERGIVAETGGSPGVGSGGVGGQPIVRCAGLGGGGSIGEGSGGRSGSSGGRSGSSGSGGNGGLTSGSGGNAGSGGMSNGVGGTEAGASGSSGFGAEGGAGGFQTRTLLFSEYVEGSGKSKALEIYASETSILDGCVVSTYFNGKQESSSRTKLKGEILGGTTWVLCSSDLARRETERCDQSANLTFNGDDAIALECDGEIIDAIGQIGVDPGDAWQDETTSTTACTLRRVCSVASGDQNGSDPFSPSAEWTGYPVDTFDDLGQYVCQD